MSDILARLIAVILSMGIHEAAHAFVSYLMGDPTAKTKGRLTLNPLAHVDPLGILCLFLFGFGWAKPVPVDHRYYKDAKTGLVWTSFAGPLANFLLGFIALFFYYFLIRHGFLRGVLLNCLAMTASISIGFGIFNLLPIPPLDGSKIFFSFLPDEKYYRIIEGNPMLMILCLVLLMSGVLDRPLLLLLQHIIDFFFGIITFIL